MAGRSGSLLAAATRLQRPPRSGLTQHSGHTLRDDCRHANAGLAAAAATFSGRAGLFPAKAIDSRTIKILYLIDYFHRTGGTEKHLSQLIDGLSGKFVCAVVVFDMGSNALLDGLRARGVPIVNLPVGREYRSEE